VSIGSIGGVRTRKECGGECLCIEEGAASENYTCIYMSLNLTQHMICLIRYIYIYIYIYLK